MIAANVFPFHIFDIRPDEHQDSITQLVTGLHHTDPSTLGVNGCSGGWEHTFSTAVSKDFECIICKLPLRDPWQLVTCGHRLCASCVMAWWQTRYPEHPLCPICGETGGVVSVLAIFSDSYARRTVLGYTVYCLMENKGCKWLGHLADYEEHETVCPEVDIPCRFACGIAKMPRKDMLEHYKVCERRTVPCTYCNDRIISNDMAFHVADNCRRAPVQCSYCKQYCVRSELDYHLNTDCPDFELSSPFRNSGCTDKVRRSKIEDHVSGAANKHMLLMSEKLDAMSLENTTLHAVVNNLRQTRHSSVVSPSGITDGENMLSRPLENIEDEKI